MRTFVSENIIEEFYRAIANNDNDFLFSVHLPHSSVHYVRESIHQATGVRYTLDYVEWAMLKEGMIEPSVCHNPSEKLSWDDYPHEKFANRRRA